MCLKHSTIQVFMHVAAVAAAGTPTAKLLHTPSQPALSPAPSCCSSEARWGPAWPVTAPLLDAGAAAAAGASLSSPAATAAQAPAQAKQRVWWGGGLSLYRMRHAETTGVAQGHSRLPH
jgi:hypothetical protein